MDAVIDTLPYGEMMAMYAGAGRQAHNYTGSLILAPPSARGKFP